MMVNYCLSIARCAFLSTVFYLKFYIILCSSTEYLRIFMMLLRKDKWIQKKIYEFRIQAELFIHILYLSFLNLHNQFDYDKYRALLMVYGVVSCLEMCHDMIILKTFSDYFFCSYVLFQLFIWPQIVGCHAVFFFMYYLCLIILIGSIDIMIFHHNSDYVNDCQLP